MRRNERASARASRFGGVTVLAMIAAAVIAAPPARPAPPTGPAAPAAREVGPEGFREALLRERGRVVLVNLWATWCSPCLKEIPDLVAVAEELRGPGVTLIGVAVDDPTPGASQVEGFRRRFFPAFTTYARAGGGMDDLASVIDPAWNEVVPTTYVIGRDGRVVERIQGRKTAAEFAAAVRRAL